MNVKSILTLLSIALAAFFIAVSCDIENDSDGAGVNQTSGSLEDNYQATVSQMQSTLTWYNNETNSASSIGVYQQRMSNDLDDLNDLRDQMRNQCEQFDDCPAGGGATGFGSDGCMSGGHMMDSDQMDQMRQDWQDCRGELSDYWEMCGGQYDPAACDQRTQNHVEQMGDILDRMNNNCEEWWSGGNSDWNEDNHDHWGDCGSGHHGGHMGDGGGWR